MSEEISARTIVKFNGKNFQIWKFQMNTLFVSFGIEDVVKGERIRPGVGVDEEGRKKWIKDNASAMFLISSSIESEQMESLLVCTTAKEMWDNLSRIHEQKSEMNKLMMTQKFHEYRMSPGDFMVHHIAKVQNMAAKLLDVGETVTNTTVMAQMLASLSSKYSTLQTVWDNVEPGRQTLENLKDRLIREEARLGTDEKSASAFVASKKKSAGDNRDAKPTSEKTNVQKKDKKGLKCFQRRIKSGESNSRERRDSSESRDCVFVAENLKEGNKELPTDVMNEVLNDEQREVWITDSGASRHITHRKEWFSVYRPLQKGGVISLGNNTECSVAGEGTLLITKYVNGKWKDGRIENVLYVPEIRKNLFSVGICTSKGYEVIFKKNSVNIKDKNEDVALGIKQKNEIYRMIFKVIIGEETNQANATTTNLQV